MFVCASFVVVHVVVILQIDILLESLRFLLSTPESAAFRFLGARERSILRVASRVPFSLSLPAIAPPRRLHTIHSASAFLCILFCVWCVYVWLCLSRRPSLSARARVRRTWRFGLFRGTAAVPCVFRSLPIKYFSGGYHERVSAIYHNIALLHDSTLYFALHRLWTTRLEICLGIDSNEAGARGAQNLVYIRGTNRHEALEDSKKRKK